MINEYIEDLMRNPLQELIIPAENVATVRKENTLLHVLMLLQNIGYSSIPVVDNELKLQGVIRIDDIIKGVIDEVNFNWELLSEKRVGEVLSKDHSVVGEQPELEDILHSLVDHNYVNVVDEDGVFRGIITRKSMFKRINYVVHELDNCLQIEPLGQPANC